MTGPSPFQIMHSMSADRSGVDGASINKATRRRVYGFAQPYRRHIIIFLATIVGALVRRLRRLPRRVGFALLISTAPVRSASSRLGTKLL